MWREAHAGSSTAPPPNTSDGTTSSSKRELYLPLLAGKHPLQLMARMPRWFVSVMAAQVSSTLQCQFSLNNVWLQAVAVRSATELLAGVESRFTVCCTTSSVSFTYTSVPCIDAGDTARAHPRALVQPARLAFPITTAHPRPAWHVHGRRLHAAAGTAARGEHARGY